MLIGLGALQIIQNLFVIMTMSSWSNFAVFDDNGRATTIHLDEGGLFLMSLLKIITAGLIVYQGYHGLKTFKPILK